MGALRLWRQQSTACEAVRCENVYLSLRQPPSAYRTQSIYSLAQLSSALPYICRLEGVSWSLPDLIGSFASLRGLDRIMRSLRNTRSFAHVTTAFPSGDLSFGPSNKISFFWSNQSREEAQGNTHLRRCGTLTGTGLFVG